jgi:hypothetical protein
VRPVADAESFDFPVHAAVLRLERKKVYIRVVVDHSRLVVLNDDWDLQTGHYEKDDGEFFDEVQVKEDSDPVVGEFPVVCEKRPHGERAIGIHSAIGHFQTVFDGLIKVCDFELLID